MEFLRKQPNPKVIANDILKKLILRIEHKCKDLKVGESRRYNVSSVYTFKHSTFLKQDGSFILLWYVCSSRGSIIDVIRRK